MGFLHDDGTTAPAPTSSEHPTMTTQPDTARRVPGTITLEYDVRMGDNVAIPAGTTVLIRKPMGGDLRGVNLGGLVRMDHDQVAMVAPRVTTPTLPQHLAGVDPADVMQVAGELVDFLLPTAAKEALFPSG